MTTDSLYNNHQAFLKLLNELPESFINNINEIDEMRFEGQTIEEYLNETSTNLVIISR